MVTGALPQRRSLIGAALGVLAAGRRGAARQKVVSFALGLREHAGTIAMMAAADFGGFQVFHHGGYFVLAASIGLLDFAVRG